MRQSGGAFLDPREQLVIDIAVTPMATSPANASRYSGISGSTSMIRLTDR
jgi:hypothetical protein